MSVFDDLNGASGAGDERPTQIEDDDSNSRLESLEPSQQLRLLEQVREKNRLERLNSLDEELTSFTKIWDKGVRRVNNVDLRRRKLNLVATSSILDDPVIIE